MSNILHASIDGQIQGTVLGVPEQMNTEPLELLVEADATLHNSVDSEGCNFLRKCVDVVITLFALYGFDRSGYSPKGTYDHWIRTAAFFPDPMKFVKWKLSSFFAFHHDQPLPVSNIPLGSECYGCILGGRGYTFLNMLKRTDRENFDSLIYSVLLSKNAMPRPDELALKRAERAAFKKLTTPPPASQPFNLLPVDFNDDQPEINYIQCSRFTMELNLRRTVFELLPDTMPEELWEKPRFPSTSANYINNQQKAGTVGSLFTTAETLDILQRTKMAPLVEIEQRSFDSPPKRQRTGLSKTRPQYNTNFLEFRTTQLTKRMDQLRTTIDNLADEETADVTLLALPEALKTRVISKGPPFSYYALKPLQKFLWSELRKNPACHLIGQPIDTDYMQLRMGKKLPDGFKFLSADYQDATNELYSWVTEMVVNAISDRLKLSDRRRSWFLKAMINHIIHYKADRYDPYDVDMSGQQKNGQLMGSIVSFPVLCIINLAVCRWALELAHNRKYTIRDAPLAVNGDDAAMKTNTEGERIWSALASFVGLKPSIGKVYFSDKFVNMNSRNFKYSPTPFYQREIAGTMNTKPVHFELTRFVNAGLLYGVPRSSTVTNSDNLFTLGANATELIELCPPAIAERTMGQFIHFNESKLRSVRIPWFIPERFGGAGLPPVGKYVPDDRSLRLARKIYDHPDRYRLPSPNLQFPWEIYQHAQRNLDKIMLKYNKPSVFVLMQEFGASSDKPRLSVHEITDYGRKLVSEDTLHRKREFGRDLEINGLKLIYTRHILKEHANNLIGYDQVLAQMCLETLFRVPRLSALFKKKRMIKGIDPRVMVKYYQAIHDVVSQALKDSDIPMPEPFSVNNFPPIIDVNANPIGVLTDRSPLILQGLSSMDHTSMNFIFSP